MKRRGLLFSIALLVLLGTSLLLGATPALAASRFGLLPLGPQMTQQLNLVLKSGDQLHAAMISQNEEQFDLALRDLVIELERARVATNSLKEHERGHLLLVLEGAVEQLELTQSSYGEERRARLESAFNQLVNLMRVYKLDHTYSIFFCPKDRTTWIQKGQRGRNPFRADSNRDPCAMKVPN